ncbi:glycosyltransferase [Agromyces sp. NPDC057865]|uniref:glycosyltransferase n=1 Tax=Agromyces sp. NPDC057865 TaxID=3346267 RepID=UPI00366F00FC
MVIASGPATADIVEDFGFERSDLRLGRGSNAGVIDPAEQPRDEADSLRGFFASTEEGAIPTLRYQAIERLADLMWEPETAARATLRIVDDIAPDRILVDHLAFSARLGLDSAGVAYGDVVLGHPTALPIGEEMYGFPPVWPSVFRPTSGDLAELRSLCELVARRFTSEWNRVGARLGGSFRPTSDAFAVHGPLVLHNYPAELVDAERREHFSTKGFLGATLRAEQVEPDIDAWIGDAERFAYVSFGSFLSVRRDVLLRIVDAARSLGLRLAIATGSTDVAQLGHLPADWLVRTYLPQVRLLSSAALAITHGGNNSVTEAIGQGVPLVVLPFSSDQFAGAASAERSGFGVVLDPNSATVEQLGRGIAAALALGNDARLRLEAVAAGQRERPGPERAFDALSA